MLLDRPELEAMIARMGKQIDAVLEGERALFIPIMKGALIFASQLALSMRTDLEFDYVHATRYDGQTSGGQIHWLHAISAPLPGRTVLLVDDILDQGHTLKAVRDDCLHRGAARVLVASLCSKKHHRLVAGITADFNGFELSDRYVFGYGMDYHEKGRNLPAIYALKENKL